MNWLFVGQNKSAISLSHSLPSSSTPVPFLYRQPPPSLTQLLLLTAFSPSLSCVFPLSLAFSIRQGCNYLPFWLQHLPPSSQKAGL